MQRQKSYVHNLNEASRWFSGKESAHQCRKPKKHRFDPWVRKIPWGRKWQPTLMFLPEKSHGWRSLASYSPWGRKESGTSEWLSMHTQCGEIARTRTQISWAPKLSFHCRILWSIYAIAACVLRNKEQLYSFQVLGFERVWCSQERVSGRGKASVGQNGQKKYSAWINTGAHFPKCLENGLIVVIGSVLLYRKGKQWEWG